jgi:hypothetical protein
MRLERRIGHRRSPSANSHTSTDVHYALMLLLAYMELRSCHARPDVAGNVRPPDVW